MKSNIADMKNAGNRYAGSITAGLFLKQYVDTEKVEWAHVDIAGCVHAHECCHQDNRMMSDRLHLGR